MGFYTDRIQRNSEICSNCFRHIAEYDKPRYVNTLKATDPVQRIRRSVWEYYQGEKEVNPDEVMGTDYGLACKCGAIGHSTVARHAGGALKREDAVLLTIPLSRRMVEMGVEFHPETLPQTVNRLKREPRVANRDDEIFAVSVERAIDKASDAQVSRR